MGNESCSSLNTSQMEEEMFEEDQYEEDQYSNNSSDRIPVCRYWNSGYCRYAADTCRFIHPNGLQTPYCRYYKPNIPNSCAYGDNCRYAHNNKPCYNWLDGYCKYGDACYYFHPQGDEEESYEEYCEEDDYEELCDEDYEEEKQQEEQYYSCQNQNYNSQQKSAQEPPPKSKIMNFHEREFCEYKVLVNAVGGNMFKDTPLMKYITVDTSRCFCPKCYEDDQVVFSRGYPRKEYRVPLGWCRIGIQVHEKHLRLFETWHRAYHGTSYESVLSICEDNLTLKPPTEENQVKRFHFKRPFWRKNLATEKDEFFDPYQIFTSPSVTYAGQETYAEKMYYETDDMSCEVQFAFQLLQQPGTYGVGQRTDGNSYMEKVDGVFPGKSVEWYTKSYDHLLIYGLLIKIQNVNFF